MPIVKATPPAPKPGELGMCDHCGEPFLAMSLREEAYAQCLRCGVRHHSTAASATATLFEAVYREMHVELLREGTLFPSLSTLGIHPSVLTRAMIGQVPEDYDVAARFEPHIQRAQQEVERLERDRPTGRPTKEYPHALGAARRQVEGLRRLDQEARECFAQHEGWLACFYESPSHEITGITFVNPEAPDQDKTALRIEDTMGTFNHGMFAPSPVPRDVLLTKRLIVVADELELLLLQSIAARRAEHFDFSPADGTVFACATGLLTDAKVVRELSRHPIVCFHASADGNELIEALRQEMNLLGFTPPVGHRTLIEFCGAVSDPKRASELLQASIEQPVLYTRPFENVREEVDDVRTWKAALFLRHRWAADRVLRDLQERGLLYWDGRRPYAFLHDTKELIVGDEDHAGFPPFAAHYGIAASDQGMYSHLLGALQLEAAAHGTVTQVHSFAHYDSKRHMLYVFDLDRSVYRVTAEEITQVVNGTDGVLFVRSPKHLPFEIGTPKGDVEILTKEILAGVQFEKGELSTDDQRLLMLVWTLSMFFPELFPTKVILAMVGAKGSGKTSLLLRLGQLLFGPLFNVSNFTTDEKDFDATITNEAFVVVDNADQPIKWLDDKLAVAATGGTLKRRLYYTTNKLVDFPITAALAITSRTPHFRREDVADRLLLFRVQRYEDFFSQAYLLEEGRAKRNAVLTEVFGLLQRAVAALKARATEHPRVKFRMADFAEFALKVTPALTGDDRIVGVLDRLARAQLAFTTEHEPLLDLIDEWLKFSSNVGRPITTGALFEELRELQHSSVRVFPFKDPQAFGLHVSSLDATLRDVFKMEISHVRSNRRQCTFWPRTEDAA
jgi:hypothetical protein